MGVMLIIGALFIDHTSRQIESRALRTLQETESAATRILQEAEAAANRVIVEVDFKVKRQQKIIAVLIIFLISFAFVLFKFFKT